MLKINFSEQLANKLKSCCKTTNTKYIAPFIDESTRWNTTLDMLKTGIHLKMSLKIFCEINNFTNYIIHDVEWDLILKLVQFLEPYKFVSTELGWDQYCTLPSVIVYFNLLLDDIEWQIFELDQKENRRQVDETLLLSFQNRRDKMLKHYAKSNWIYCACLILDPRHKTETFDHPKWCKEMKEKVINIFKDILKTYSHDQSVPLQANSVNAIQPSNNVTSSITTTATCGVDFFCKWVNSMYGNEASSWGDDIDKYISSPRVSKDTDISY